MLVTIINYDMGNLHSVQNAFKYFNIETKLTNSPDDILNAQSLILPGVGAFGDGMNNLKKYNLIEPIQIYCQQNKPFLGICLGMQMMLSDSEEFGFNKGLNIIPGHVKLINDKKLKIPHIGWNQLSSDKDWNNTILEGLTKNDYVYFVHSYTAIPDDINCRLADTHYGDQLISSVIKKGNLYGTQFHPEKSGKVGLKIIENFIKLSNQISS